ncbi:DUF1254 domain-containing protein [Rhodomicrobium sp. R_RK_3]|uniref:DUF1254 domain-containing protein n=1 Tax=Rhodomicrobium sp. R_RK_3 TaxID=2029567 RepID=UPI001FD8E27C|nr:DUF1254 domain-containing protein [Rhodomicrobium sp. R_RK_3]
MFALPRSMQCAALIAAMGAAIPAARAQEPQQQQQPQQPQQQQQQQPSPQQPSPQQAAVSPETAPVSADEARDIAIEAYIYAYPMVIMALTQEMATNAETADGSTMRAPVNQFANARRFPDADFTEVVRPNADTLYSALWFDLSREPLIIHVPNSGGRYYLLEMMDMWSDVFAAPGKRTTGTDEQIIALVGPGWEEDLPPEIEVIRSPTSAGWIIGRTQTNGVADYDNVHKFQDGLVATPLSALGSSEPPPRGTVDANIDMTVPPVAQVEKLGPEEFFSIFGELTEDNPPHANDYPMLHRMARIGLEPGTPFSLDDASPEVRAAIEQAPAAALKKIKEKFATAGVSHDGWRTNLVDIGTYGTDYLARAGVAYAGLGANTVEDAIYPTALTDPEGKPFSSDRAYVVHFDKDQVPPVRAFWSLTMYNDKQLFAANPLNRYTLGDRDRLTFNPDGSLDIYVQRDNPGPEKEANWLPAPASGDFTMNLRLYWPKPAALDGSWTPPAVRPVTDPKSG